MKLNIIILAAALSFAVSELQKIGVLNADGSFNEPNTQQDVALATLAEQMAVQFGVHVPAKVQNVVTALPLLISLVG